MDDGYQLASVHLNLHMEEKTKTESWNFQTYRIRAKMQARFPRSKVADQLAGINKKSTPILAAC